MFSLEFYEQKLNLNKLRRSLNNICALCGNIFKQIRSNASINYTEFNFSLFKTPNTTWWQIILVFIYLFVKFNIHLIDYVNANLSYLCVTFYLYLLSIMLIKNFGIKEFLSMGRSNNIMFIRYSVSQKITFPFFWNVPQIVPFPFRMIHKITNGFRFPKI